MNYVSELKILKKSVYTINNNLIDKKLNIWI